MVTKYHDYVTIYIPLDCHGDITEFLDAIIPSLEIHIQIVACFRVNSFRSEICLIGHCHPSTIWKQKTISFLNNSLLIELSLA